MILTLPLGRGPMRPRPNPKSPSHPASPTCGPRFPQLAPQYTHAPRGQRCEPRLQHTPRALRVHKKELSETPRLASCASRALDLASYRTLPNNRRNRRRDSCPTLAAQRSDPTPALPLDRDLRRETPSHSADPPNLPPALPLNKRKLTKHKLANGSPLGTEALRSAGTGPNPCT